MIHAQTTVVSEKVAQIMSQKAIDLVNTHNGKIVEKANSLSENYSVQEDLISCGRIALFNAVPKYQDKGHKFSTYATVVVRNAMNSALTSQFNQLSGLKNKKVRKNYFTNNQLNILSLDNNVNDDCAFTYSEIMDTATPSDFVLEREIIERFHQSWRTILTEDQYRIIVLHFYDDCNFRQVGEKIGMKTSTVHYNYTCAIEKLREWIGL